MPPRPGTPNPALLRKAAAEAERRRRELARLPLGEFIQRVSQKVIGPYAGLENPAHLSPFLEVFDTIERGEPVYALIDTPPQHGKTALELYGLVRYLARHRGHTVVFGSYSASVANAASFEARRIAGAARIELDTDNVTRWRTATGGTFIPTSVDGPATGVPNVKVFVVDDPFKGRAEAESKVERDKVFAWLTASVLSRAHPDSSVIVVHTRWHEDDLIGRLKDQLREGGREKRWRHIHLPAIDAHGQALWPKHRPLWWLNDHRAGMTEYDWWSLYMGEPRPRGGALFGDVTFYDALPSSYRVAIGVDLSYTAKTHADYSVAVVLFGAYEPGPDGKKRLVCYVRDVVRMQVSAPEFAGRLKALASDYPGAKLLSYAYGPEKGNVDWLRKEGVPLVAKQMTGDKYVRAQPVAGAWQHGLVRVPRSRASIDPSLPPSPERDKPPPWSHDFVSELASFTGIHDPHDDQVDALAAAYDALARKPAGGNAGHGFVPGTALDDREFGV